MGKALAGRRNPAFSEAAEELELFFGANDGILGLHGVGFGGGSTTVWDEARCNLAHAQCLVKANAAEPEQLRLITPTIRQLLDLHPEHWETALLAYTPRRWPEKLHAELSRGGRGGNLVGLALIGPKLREVWAKRELGRREAEAKRLYKAGNYPAVVDIATRALEPSITELLTLAANEAESSDASRKRLFFARIMRDGEDRLDKALETYEKLRAQRRQRAKAAARAEAMS